LQLIALHGEEADRHLLRCLFSFVEVGSADSKGSLQIQLLQQECATLVSKHRVASNLCYAFEQTIHLQKVKMTQRPAGFQDFTARFKPARFKPVFSGEKNGLFGFFGFFLYSFYKSSCENYFLPKNLHFM